MKIADHDSGAKNFHLNKLERNPRYENLLTRKDKYGVVDGHILFHAKIESWVLFFYIQILNDSVRVEPCAQILYPSESSSAASPEYALNCMRLLPDVVQILTLVSE